MIGLAILIGAAEFAQRGCDLFSVKDSRHEEEVWAFLCAEPHFEKIMSFNRWKEFCRFFPAIFVDETRKESVTKLVIHCLIRALWKLQGRLRYFLLLLKR